MAFVTIGTAVDLSLLKMKWREQYVSEGLNRKIIPDSPAGIYRGLRLEFDATQLAGERRVAIKSGSDDSHEAVYQNTTGHSLTYHDNSGSDIILDLSAPGLDSTETIIAMFVDYQIGADTTAEWRAYPLADFNALPAAEKDELLILGTVDVPAASTNVTASMIRLQRRRYAWENRAPGGNEWEALIAGPGFEVGAVGTGRYDIAHWVTEETAGSGTWDLQGDARTGEGGLRMMNISGASWVSELRRYLGTHVRLDQVVRYRIFKKTQAVTAGGAVSLRFVFEDAGLTVGSGTSHDVSIPANVVDAGFVEVGGLFSPEEAGLSADSVLRYVALRSDGTDAATTVDFDGVQVWLERGEGADPGQGTGERVGGVGYFSPLFLAGQGDVFSATGAAILDFNDSANEVDVVNPQNVDQAGNIGTTNESPNLRVRGTVSIGEDRLRNTAEKNEPRITTAIATGVNEFTLVWESGAGASGKKSRLYVEDTGHYVLSFNCKYDNLTLNWTADVNSDAAHKIRSRDGGLEFYRKQDTSVAWADASAWDPHQMFDFARSPMMVSTRSNFDGNDGAGWRFTEDANYDGGSQPLVEILKNTDNGGGAGLFVEKKPPTSAPGDAISVETNSNSTGDGVSIDHSGSGQALNINHSGAGVAGHAISIVHDGSGNSDGIQIVKTGGSGESISITDSGTGEALFISNSNSNNAVEITNSTTSTALLINQNGSGAGIDVNSNSSGIAIYADSNGSGDCMQLDNSTGGFALDINHFATGACIDVSATSITSGDIMELRGQGGSNFSFIRYGRLRIDGSSSANTAAVLQCDGAYASLTSDLIQFDTSTSQSSSFNLCRMFVSAGSDPSWRVNGLGQMFADNGTVGTPADYAEYVEVLQNKDNYESGDVLAFTGAEKMFDLSAAASTPLIAGVISTQPMVLGNASGGCDEFGLDIETGTVESSDWTLENESGEPDDSDFDRIVINGNRAIDYAVNTYGRVTLDAAKAGITFRVASVSYDGGTNKTTVVMHQGGIPKQHSSGTHILYYGMTQRNVRAMAMLGQVPVKCITENGTISPGDLLVASSTPGHAMKAGGSPVIGTILGKAMETLTDTGSGSDTGLIIVYVNLH